MIQTHPSLLLFALCALVLAGTFLFLCKRGVIPEPIASHALKIAAGIATIGILPLLRMALGGTKKNNANERAKLIEIKAPTQSEVEATDTRLTNAKESGERAREELEHIDQQEEESREKTLRGDSDPDAGSIARERLRELQA